MQSPRTIIRNASPSRPYTKICNTVLQDYSISLEASGFVTRMLSLPNNWVFRKTWALKEFRVGETKLRRIMKEITSAGYCRIEQGRQDSGAFSSVIYSFTDVSGEFTDMEGSDGGCDRSADQPLVGFGGLQTKDSYKEKIEKTPLPPMAMETAVEPAPSCVRGECATDVLNSPLDQSDVPTPGESVLSMEEKVLELTPPEPEKAATKKKRAKPETKACEDDPLFMAFWAEYPKKVKRFSAFKVWEKQTQAVKIDLPKAAKAYSLERDRASKSAADRKKYSTDPNKWIKERFFEDYLQKEAPVQELPLEKTMDWFQEQEYLKMKRAEAMDKVVKSPTLRERFVDVLSKVLTNVKDAWDLKVQEFFHAKSYRLIEKYIPIDLQNEARMKANIPLLSA